MKDYDHQVHLTVFGNREFHHHTNKEKTKFLKLSNTEKTATKNSFFSKQNRHSKNVNLASTTSGGQSKTVQLLIITNFIQDTMATSSTYSGKSKAQLEFSLTQQDKQLI